MLVQNKSDAERNVNREQQGCKGEQMEKRVHILQDESKIVFLSWATFGFQLQVFYVYFASALQKTAPEWRNGEAIYFALNAEQFTTSLGMLLLRFPRLLIPLSLTVYAAEFVLPSLFFSPYKTATCKLVAAIGLSLLHLGFASCLHVGLFAWQPHAIMLAFYPPQFWDWLFDRLATAERRCLSIVVSEKAPCYNLLSLYVYFFLLPGTPIQSSTKVAEAVTPSTSLRVLKFPNSSRPLCGYQAILALVEASPLLWPLAFLGNLLPTACKSIYNNFSGPFVSAVESGLNCLILNHLRTGQRRVVSSRNSSAFLCATLREVLALFFVIFISWWLASYLYHVPLPPQIKALGPSLRLDQGWGNVSSHVFWVI